MAGRLIRYAETISSCDVPGPVGKMLGSSVQTITPGPNGFNDIFVKGPETIGETILESRLIESSLLFKSKDLERKMLEISESYFQEKDFRWFLIYTYAQFTKQLNQNLTRC